jgi:hypothetical protein
MPWWANWDFHNLAMGQNSQWRQIDDDHNPSLEPRQPSWHHRQMGFGSQETNKK